MEEEKTLADASAMRPQELVDIQAEDEGLWFVAETASEAYLQKALRDLHAAIEADVDADADARTQALMGLVNKMYFDEAEPTRDIVQAHMDIKAALEADRLLEEVPDEVQAMNESTKPAGASNAPINEPKPCPFCGASDFRFFEGSSFRWLAYSCGGCGMGSETRIQTIGFGLHDERQKKAEEWRKKAEQDAIEEWNHREPSDEFERGRQQGMLQERALWELTAEGQAMSDGEQGERIRRRVKDYEQGWNEGYEATLMNIEELLVNLQPHIPQACQAGHESFIGTPVDEALRIIRQALARSTQAAPASQEAPSWISVEDRMPGLGPNCCVLATYQTNYGKPTVVRAYFAPKHTIESTNDADEFADYSEEDDCYYTPEGWYECNTHEETNWQIDKQVTHWMPLPKAPVAIDRASTQPWDRK